MKRLPLVSIKRYWACLCALGAVLAYWSGATSPAQAQQTSSAAPINAAQYGTAMAQVQTDCAIAAESQGDAKCAAKALADIQPLLRPAVLETGAQGAQAELVYVDNRSLAGQIQAASSVQAKGGSTAAEAQTSRWLAIASSIAQIRATLPVAPPPSAPGGDAHALAVRVLDGSDFASEPIPPKSVWERMGDAIQRWLNKLHFPHARVAPVSGVSPVVPEIILIVIIGTAIGLIVYFTVVWLRNRAAQTSLQKRAGELDLAFTAEEKELVATHNYARLRALADDAAQSGDFRSGYRLVFLALLVYLDSEGAIRLNRSKTNWEYLRSLPMGGGSGGVREILRPVVREFDRIWYGESPASQREFDLAAGAYSSIQTAVEAQREAVDPDRLAGANAAGARVGRR